MTVKISFTIPADPHGERVKQSRVTGTGPVRESGRMAVLYQRYLEYRGVGFNRMQALRLAWLVSMAGLRPAPLRHPAKR